jgi:hypothetical protein
MLIQLYLNDISMRYIQTESASKAAIEVKAKLLGKYLIMYHGPAWQFLDIEIQCDDHCINLCQKAFITRILMRYHFQDANGVTTAMHRNGKLDLAINLGENLNVDMERVKHYLLIVRSLMFPALAMRPDISYAVAALCRYNSCPFTSHLTAAK